MSRVGQESKGVNQEFGDNEERVKDFRIVGVLARVELACVAGIERAQ
jgi:hypothetical protein